MSQTYRIGSLNFTGSQAVLSASLDVSGSGRFTNGLTVNGSGNVFTVANNSGTTFFRIADTGITETLGASSGNYSLVVNSNAASGGSFGLSVVAGTNTSDNAIRVRNKALTTDLFVVRGDGTTFTNNLTATGSLTVAGGDLSVVTGSTNYLRIFPSTGNTFIGSTPVDGGFKLDVNGTTRLQNALTVSTGGATITGNTVVSGSLNVSGSVTSTGILTTYNGSIATLPVILRGGNVDGSIFIGGSAMVGSAGTRNIVIDPIGTYSTFGVGGVGQNVVVGRVGSNITTGASNILIGNMGGGSAVTTGVNNIFIGGTNGAEFSFTGSASKRIYISTGVELGTEGVSKAAPTGSSGWVFIGGSSTIAATNQFYFGASPQISHSFAASYSDITIYAPSAIGTDFYGGNFIINAGRGTGTGSAGDVVFATSTTGSAGSTLQTLSNRVWVKGHTGFVGIGVANPSYTLDVSGSGDFSGGLTVTGSATINDILVITPRTTTPANPASGSIIVSGSGATIRPYFWDGSTWTQMFT